MDSGLILWIIDKLPLLGKGLAKLASLFAKFRIKPIERCRDDRDLYDYLKWKYGTDGIEILERCGYTYPVALFRAPKSQQGDINSVIGEYVDDMPGSATWLTYSNRYRRIMKLFHMQLDKEYRENALYNGSSYAMSSMVADKETLKVNCQLGSFYSLLDTCYSLEWELLKQWSRKKPKSIDPVGLGRFDKKLKLRSRLHSHIADPLRDGSRRSAGLAISGLIAYRDKENKLNLFVRSRSTNQVALYPGFHHVIPSGQVQPLENPEEEIRNRSLGGAKLSFYREYLEELFSYNDPSLPKPNQKDNQQHGEVWQSIYSDIRLKELLCLLDDPDKAEFRLTGVMVNLFNLQPEICTFLYIKTPDWFTNHTSNASSEQMKFRINVEWARLQNVADAEKRKYISHMPYSDKDEVMMEYGGKLYPWKIVPNGAASFWLGIDTLRHLLADDTQRK